MEKALVFLRHWDKSTNLKGSVMDLKDKML